MEGEGFGQETERPLKRLRRGRDVPQVLTFLDTDLNSPKLEEDEQTKTCFLQQPQNVTGSPEPMNDGSSISPQYVAKNKGKQPMISEPPVQLQRLGPLSSPGKSIVSRGLFLREPVDETGSDRFPRQLEMVSSNDQFIKPKDEPFTDDMFMGDKPQYEDPIAVIHQGI